MSAYCYRFSRLFAHAFFSPFARLETWRTADEAEPPGAGIVAANHISHFDPVLLSVVFRRSIDWMTTEEFYSNSLLAALLHGLDTIPVDRARPDHRALRLAVERLRAGRLVGVFPEGGLRTGPRSILGGATPKSGATGLARLTGVAIIPCVIFGSDRFYAPRSWWPTPPRTKVWVAIGAPLSVATLSAAQATQRLAEALRSLGAASVTHFALGPDDLPATPQRRKGRDAQLAA